MFPSMTGLCCQLMISFLCCLYVSKPLIFPFAVLYTNKCMALLRALQFRLWVPIWSWNTEEKALSTFSSPPVFWKRYVDDVCTAIDRTKILAFLEHLNNIHPYIQFRHEMENSNKCLPFLDVLLESNDDGCLSTLVYRKLSHTDRYLDFSSHHPLMHKASVVRSLFNRAKGLSSCAVRLNQKNCHILNVLKANHYPKRFIDNAYLTDCHKHSSEETPSKTVVIPYIKGLSEGIKRIFSNIKVKVVFRPPYL